MVKTPPCNARDTSSIPGLGRSLHAMEQLSLWATSTGPTLRAQEPQPLSTQAATAEARETRANTAQEKLLQCEAPHSTTKSSPRSLLGESLRFSADPPQPKVK